MVELRKVLRALRFRTTSPTNDVGLRKRFVAKNVSGNMRDVKVELKVEVWNDGALRKALRRFSGNQALARQDSDTHTPTHPLSTAQHRAAAIN